MLEIFIWYSRFVDKIKAEIVKQHDIIVSCEHSFQDILITTYDGGIIYVDIVRVNTKDLTFEVPGGRC